ncbi:MAG: S41 family peptidase, partial [Myxococcota bacterium]
QELGSLLVGPQFPDTLLMGLEFNPVKSSEYDSTFRLQSVPSCDGFDAESCSGPARPLTRLREVVFIVTESTASASEMVINGLQPLIPVRLVGSRTFGKPVGSLSFQHSDCEQVFVPTTFRVVNAENQGGFYEGIQPDCFSIDDVTREYGDPKEASLAAALSLLENGQCPTQGKVRASAASGPRWTLDLGWRL